MNFRHVLFFIMRSTWWRAYSKVLIYLYCCSFVDDDRDHDTTKMFCLCLLSFFDCISHKEFLFSLPATVYVRKF